MPHFLCLHCLPQWHTSSNFFFFFFCNCFSKQEQHRDHFLASLLAFGDVDINVKSVHFYLCFSNKASSLMKLHTHIGHDALCALPLTVTDLGLLFLLEQCSVFAFSSVWSGVEGGYCHLF